MCEHTKTMCHIDKLSFGFILFSVPTGYSAYIYCTECGIKGPEIEEDSWQNAAHEAKLAWLRMTHN